MESARETPRTVPGAGSNFEPFIWYHICADSSINLTGFLRVNEYVEGHLVTHDFTNRLRRRDAEAGVQIPFPQRVVHVR